MRKWLWFWVPVILYIGFIFWLSSAPRSIPGIKQFPWLDKVFHFAEYAPLGTLLIRAFRRSFTQMPRGQAQLFSFLQALWIGILDEWLQRRIPLRVSSPWDTFWDCVGAVAGQQLYRRRKLANTP